MMRKRDVFFILGYFLLLVLRNLNPIYFKKTGHCRTVVYNRKNFSKSIMNTIPGKENTV